MSPITSKAAVKVIKAILKLLGWMIPIVVLVWALVAVVFKKEVPVNAQKPDELILSYMRIAMEYAPPALKKPGPLVYRDILAMFTPEDAKWVQENFNFLAWMGLQQMDNDFRKADSDARTHAACSFLLSRGPTRPVTVQKVIYSDDSKAATVSLSSLTDSRQVELVQIKGQWHIKGLWDLQGAKLQKDMEEFKKRGLNLTLK